MRFLFIALLVFGCVSGGFSQPDKNVLASVNSSRDEMNPILSPDGQTLYLTIANHPQNIGGKNDPGDIWVSKWTGETWSPPEHGGTSINDMAYNAVAGVSEDHTKLFLLSHYHLPHGRARTQGISVAHRAGDKWSEPKNIQIPYFLNRSVILSGCFNKSLDVFIFSAENYGTLGVEDLYITTLTTEGWSEARNLGSVINTRFQELTPWLSDDGLTLYFSSNGRKGLGSFDVYSSTRLDNSWASWSEPVNLGSQTNTEGRDLYYRSYPEFGFEILTSTQNSDGYSDIKFHRRNDPLVHNDPVQEPIIRIDSGQLSTSTEKLPETPKVNNAVTLRGSLIDSKTGTPVRGTVTITSESGESVSLNDVIGEFQMGIKDLALYTISAQAPGYVNTFERVNIKRTDLPEVEMVLRMQPIEVGATVNLRNVLFVQSKAELLPESFDELNVVIKFLQENPAVKIELGGHTDNRGIHADNVRLSQARVNTVKQYLVSNGVNPKRITGKGYGGTRPIASNDTEDTRKMNRRVEFTIRKF